MNLENNNRVIVVLGMHRSGTSAIARSLKALGVSLGNELFSAGFDNPKGFWEDKNCLEINNKLLEHLGSDYDQLAANWPAIKNDTIIEELTNKAIRTITQNLEKSGGIWGFKDPRTCRLLQFWKNVFSSTPCDASYIITLRNPLSVAASLAKRNQISAEKSHYLWLQHTLPAVAMTKGSRRVVVDYDLLMKSPLLQLQRIASALDLPIPDEDAPATIDYINHFIDQDLRHTLYDDVSLEANAHVPLDAINLYNLLKKISTDAIDIDSNDVTSTIADIEKRIQSCTPAFSYINFLEDSCRNFQKTIGDLNELVKQQHNELDFLNSQAMAKLKDPNFVNGINSLSNGINSLSLSQENLAKELGTHSSELATLLTGVQNISSELSATFDPNYIDSALQKQLQWIESGQNKLNELEKNLYARERDLSDLQKLHEQLTHKCHELGKNKHDLEFKVSEIYASTSWFVTKPMRFASRLISRSKRFLPYRTQKARPAQTVFNELPADFDETTYLSLNPDVAKPGINPTMHYLTHGQYEGRAYIAPKPNIISVKEFDESKDTILIVSHDASRTGAPILTLNILQTMREKHNVVALLLGPGNLQEAFSESANEVIYSPEVRNCAPMAAPIVREICSRHKFSFAIINSIESRAVLRGLALQSVPTVSLFHEFASYTRPRDAFLEAFLWSTQVVFSTNLTLENALAECPSVDKEPIEVIPQGICNVPKEIASAEVIELEQKRIRNIVRPDSLAEDCIVILGVGTVQLRKGVDLFLDCASKIASLVGINRCRFVWLGAGYNPNDDVSYSVYLADQIQRAGLQDCVVFGGETSEIDIAYQLSDIFILSSRLDPLPHVAMEAMAHTLPIVCFDKTTGIADFLKENGLEDSCVAKYLDVSDLALKIKPMVESDSYRAEVGKNCREVTIRSFQMKDYVSKLEQLGQKAKSLHEQQEKDRTTIMESGLFNTDFSIPSYFGHVQEETAVSIYMRSWATGIRQRKPYPGFHPGMYLERHGVSCTGADPFADYLRNGHPKGPWRAQVIEAQKDSNDIKAPRCRCAVHIHAYYPDLVKDILQRLEINNIKPDLFISVSSEAAKASVTSMLHRYRGRIVDVVVVPNRGRDIGPMLTAFGSRLVEDYDYIGHFHTKKSLDAGDAEMAAQWNSFILENLLGGQQGGRMMDQILSVMHADTDIGIVFPDDPNVVGWGENKPYADKLAAQLGLIKLNDSFNFPVGTMFWTRSTAFKNFVELGLKWEDYPTEPVGYDGSVLHALERLFGLMFTDNKTSLAVTYVPGITR
ncbi:rhamnan synthesis F family protein [Plasticicumulans acidivorans]|uniref:Glycosyl transferase family 1 domain-containing protein n=1 Tax=Plasticicumulans acidivorans TaxID=886464 RepID=A0A317MXU6_9GAMM|nr:rhamnan synthesis F family protein [Plasticicumulans acidivorans]PWV64470.1 hypothetical protein C7443_102119 [Plasticicumulans acidivorans]